MPKYIIVYYLELLTIVFIKIMEVSTRYYIFLNLSIYCLRKELIYLFIHGSFKLFQSMMSGFKYLYQLTNIQEKHN